MASKGTDINYGIVFKQQKKPLIFIPLIVLFLFIILIPPHKSVYLKSGFLPFFKYPLSVFYHINLSVFHAKKIFSFYSEYSSMKKEIKELKFKLNQVEEAEHENARLRKILDLKEKGLYDFAVAQIIAKEPTNWLNSFIINKGQKHGIGINQPVMSFSNLVGKIIEVGDGTAKVLLISDANSRVVALIQRTRAEGVLEGMGNGLCRLKYLPVNADVKLGDEVVSAGVGGVYPKGLIIGNIESIRIERGGIYKSGIVKPAAALSCLEEVLCLKLNLKQ